MSKGEELKTQGLQLFRDGAYAEALVAFNRAQEQFNAEGDRQLEAEMLNNIGVIHRSERQVEQALAAFSAALEVFRALIAASEHDEEALKGAQSGEAQTLGNLAYLYALQDDTESAITCYREAATTFLELDDNDNYGQTLMALGDLQFKTGKRQDGLATYQVGLEFIESPTLRQKMMLQLKTFQARLMGLE